MLWTSKDIHLIFIYIPIKLQMLFTLWKPYVIFPLKFPLLLLLETLCHVPFSLPISSPSIVFPMESYGDVMCGTSHLCSLNCPSCGDVIYGTSIVCLATCTIVGIVDGSNLPFIIFYAFAFMLSCSLFTLEL
jgi:hypothetical protein